MKEFRKDINGLRCVAVLAVLFYHFGIPGFTGGYIGVDVFFVISGYLMTDIILSKLGQNNFSLIDFWLSRARRIIPALYILLIAVIAFGWFWEIPHSYSVLAKFSVASALFVSNIIFEHEAGNYFGEHAHENWLLHTWSLSVEWQFYFIYPLILMAVYKIFKSSSAMYVALRLWFLMSLVLCLYKTPINPTAAFYFLSARTWEFLTGAFVYILLQRFKPGANTNRILESAGLLIIIASIVVFQENTLWPGYHAIIPVMGTAFVIAAGNRNALWSNNAIVENIGKWSYSIYLWHWPVIVGLRFFEYQANKFVYTAAFLLSILTGGLSYHWVENPIRTMKWGRAQGASYAFSAVLFMVIAGLIIIRNQGIPSRVPEAVAIIGQEFKSESIENCKIKSDDQVWDCILGNKSNITAAVWGDSHAQATIPGIAKAAEQHGQGVIFYSKPGCPTIIGADIISTNRDKNTECILFNEHVLHRLQPRKDIAVIIISRFSHYVNNNLILFDNYIPSSPEQQHQIFQSHLIKSLCAIASERKVYVLKPTPEMRVNVPRKMLKSLRTHTTSDEIFITNDDYANDNSVVLSALEMAKDKCGIVLLDPVPYLCKNNKCYGAFNGIPLYSDDDHLSNYGSQALLPLFAQIFK